MIHASEVNYVILTAEQFGNDYPQYITAVSGKSQGPVLVLTDDEDGVVALIEGDNAAMLAELVNDINDYAKANADPGEVVAAVGRSSTVLPGR